MSAKKTMKAAALAVVAAAAVSMVGSSAGAAMVGPGSGAGVISGYDNGSFRFELGAITGQGVDPKLCVKITNLATDRRAEGCGSVGMWVHPTLEAALVQGTIQGTLFQASNGRSMGRTVPINLDLTYQGIGMYQPLVLTPQSRLWLAPLDVAAAEGAGLARAAWGWGSVKAPLCRQAATAPSNRRRPRTTTTTPVVCGPSTDVPSFAGTIAETVTASAGISS